MADIEAAAYELDGGPVGILLVHGFTASPTELRPLGDHLHQAGYRVSGLRLAGHGTQVDDMAQTGWRDWHASVLAGYDSLAPQCEHVVAAGLSMGAVLCCQLALERSLLGLVLLAPAFAINSRFLSLAPYLRFLVRRWPKSASSLAYYRQHGLFSYPTMPVSSLAQLHRLIRRVRPQVPQVETPCKIFMGMRDTTVVPQSGFTLYRDLGSRRKSLVLLPNSDHILTVEPDAPLLFAQVQRFIDGLAMANKNGLQP